MLIYDTTDNLSTVVSDYQSWLEAGEFTIDNTDRRDTSATIRATRGTDRLTVSVATVEGNRRVQISYITQEN